MSPENTIQDRFDAADDAMRLEEWDKLIELARIYGKRPDESWQMFFHRLHANDNALDMFRDEFQRIAAMLYGHEDSVWAEIRGICERAISGIESRVPLIKQIEEVKAESDMRFRQMVNADAARQRAEQELTDIRARLRDAEASVLREEARLYAAPINP